MTDKALTTSTTGREVLAGDRGGLEQNPAAVYLASLESAQSRRTMQGALNSIAALLLGTTWDAYKAEHGKEARALCLSFPWHELRFQHVQAVRAKLAGELAAATVNKRLSALRGVLGAAFDLGQIDAATYQRAIKVKSVKGDPLPAGRSITAGEFSALMGACMADQTPSGPRDAAILGILYSCGLRRAELVRLDLADFDHEGGALIVRGKRNKERTAYPAAGALDALADWLTFRGNDPGALFWAIRRGGHIQRGQRLTTQAIYHVLAQRAEQANVKELSPHDFRRTFVGDLLDAGADIATVQKMAGHASVTTTARYDRRPEEAKRKAAQLLHVPYSRRTLGTD